MGPQWALNGPSMGPQWALNRPSMGPQCSVVETTAKGLTPAMYEFIRIMQQVRQMFF